MKKSAKPNKKPFIQSLENGDKEAIERLMKGYEDAIFDNKQLFYDPPRMRWVVWMTNKKPPKICLDTELKNLSGAIENLLQKD